MVPCVFCSREAKEVIDEIGDWAVVCTQHMNKWYSRTASLKTYRDNVVKRWKMRAYQTVRRALVNGQLKKRKECQRCGGKRGLVGHHWSYEKKDWLDVEWLCGKCHALWHRKNNAVLPLKDDDGKWMWGGG